MTDNEGRNELWEYGWHRPGCMVATEGWYHVHSGEWPVGNHRAYLQATLKDCTCGLALQLQGRSPLAAGESSLGFHLEDHPNISGLRMVVYDGGRCAMPAGPVEVALWDEVQRLRKQLDDEPEPPYVPLKIGHWTLEFTDGTRLQGSAGELRA